MTYVVGWAEDGDGEDADVLLRKKRTGMGVAVLVVGVGVGEGVIVDILWLARMGDVAEVREGRVFDVFVAENGELVDICMMVFSFTNF